MSKVLGGVIRGENNQGELYYIHLETGLKVSAHKSGVKRIQLIQDELYKDEMEYVAELQRNSQISKEAFEKLKEVYESQKLPESKEDIDNYDEIVKYFQTQKAYTELVYAIHVYYMPEVKLIKYSFYHGDKPEQHTIEYGYGY